MDASDIFSTPGGFSPPVEAWIQQGFVVRLLSCIAPSVFNPGQCYQALPEGCRGNSQNAQMCHLKWVAYTSNYYPITLCCCLNNLTIWYLASSSYNWQHSGGFNNLTARYSGKMLVKTKTKLPTFYAWGCYRV